MIELLASDRGRLAALVILCGLLWAIESIVPLFALGDRRARHALPNLGLTALLVAVNLVLSFGTAAVVAVASARGIGLLHAIALPAWATLLVGLVGLDGLAYVAHRLLHELPAGWRFHRVHHCDADVDVTTAFRQHPFETVWRMAWQLAGMLALGLPLWVVAIYLVVSAANAELEHANVRVPARLDRVLRLVFVTPHMHKVHHSRDQRETDSNYSNIFSWWDRVLGTYTARDDLGGLRYGLDDVRADTLWGLLRMPFHL